MAVKAVLFDFGRVLGNFDHMKACKGFSDACGKTPEEVYDIVFREGLNDQHETVMPADVFYRSVCDSLGMDIQMEMFKEIWGNIFWDNEGAEELVYRLKPGVGKAIVSNTTPIHWEYIKELPAVKLFAGEELVRSYDPDVRQKKPGERIFDKAVLKAGHEPQEILFIDDIEDYTEAFRKNHGGQTGTYDCSRQDISVLEGMLSRYGVID